MYARVASSALDSSNAVGPNGFFQMPGSTGGASSNGVLVEDGDSVVASVAAGAAAHPTVIVTSTYATTDRLTDAILFTSYSSN
jgi:hypothetical protein